MNNTNKVCTICTRELIPVIDGDDVVCAQCRAEELHDFDVDPNAIFDRRGIRINTNEI